MRTEDALTALTTSMGQTNDLLRQVIAQMTDRDNAAQKAASDKKDEAKKKKKEAEDKKKAEFEEEVKRLRKELDKVTKNWNHQEDILDEIEKSTAKISKLEKEREKYSEGSLDYAEKTVEIEKERLDLQKKRNQAQIEGYNQLDRLEKDNLNRTQQLRTGIKQIGEGAKKIGDSVNKIVGPWGKMSQAAANYAKNIGLSAVGMERLRKSTIDLTANRGIGIKYNTSVEELLGLQQDYTKNVGRQVGLTSNDLETLAATSRILGSETASDFMAKFEKFGLSMEEAGSRAGKMFADASKRGIAWENYSKNFLDNITLAQRYTFKNGTRGLESMAKKATEINLNMSQAASFAEKVNTVEGAIRTGAQLQVLGGPFAQMSDPIGMLYESLNDMEGLQDRMVQMFGNLGSFNRQTGEVEISAFNRMRIREAAKSMGIDESNIFESINSNARRNEISRQLDKNQNGLNSDVKDLVKNIGTIRNGVAGVTINGEFKAANQITNADQKILTEISRSESDDVKDIAVRLRGWEDSIQGFTKQKDAAHGQLVESMGIGRGVQSLINEVGEMKRLLMLIAGGTMLMGGISTIGGLQKMIQGGSHVVGGAGNLIAQSGKQSARNGTLFAGKDGTAYATNWKGNWVNKDTGQIVSRAERRVLDEQLGRSVGATAGKKALRRGASMRIGGAVMKGANIAGWAGLGAELLGDYHIRKHQERRGKFEDYAASMGGRAASGAALGASIGSLIPVLGQTGIGQIAGALIGGVWGGISGAVKARKNQLTRQIEEETGAALNGSYKKSELKQIRAAERGEGQISEALMEKMRMNGDQEALNRIDKVANSVIANGAVKTRVVDAQKKATGGIIQGQSTTGDKNVVMSNAGEMVLNKQQQENLFNAIASNDFSSLVGTSNTNDLLTSSTSLTQGISETSLDKGQEERIINAIMSSGVLASTTKSVMSDNNSIANNATVIVPDKTQKDNLLGVLPPEVKASSVKNTTKPEVSNTNEPVYVSTKKSVSFNEPNIYSATSDATTNINPVFDQSVPVKTPVRNKQVGNINSLSVLPTENVSKPGLYHSPNVAPRTESVSVAPPVPSPARTMKIEFGKLDINFKANDIKVIDPSGNSKNIELDIEALRKQIEQNLLLKISEQLERMNHGGRLVPEKGYLYQQK